VAALYVDVEPDLLRWAVARAGWDEETIDRRAPNLDNWLDQEKRPTLRQLEKFARDTHTPLGQMFLEEPPVEAVPIPDMRTVQNTQIAQPSADLLDTIYLCQEHQDWYREFARSQEFDPIEFIGSATLDDRPKLVADRIRTDLNFGPNERSAFGTWEDAFRELINRIEDIGVIVKVNGVVGANPHRTLRPEEFRGFALSDGLAPLIFVNGADTKAAQIFTIIHELAHLYLGESALSDAAMEAVSSSAHEVWCNKVAAEVLVPQALLRSDYSGTATSQELDRLARRYKVSTLVLLKSIYDAGLLSWDAYVDHYDAEYRRVMNRLSERRADGSRGNYYYTQPIRLSRRFAQAVLASTFEGTTTYRDAYHLLGTKKHRTLVGLAEQLGVA
jgi:Zn-dependent peptidase ImmA (M78 family)